MCVTGTVNVRSVGPGPVCHPSWSLVLLAHVVCGARFLHETPYPRAVRMVSASHLEAFPFDSIPLALLGSPSPPEFNEVIESARASMSPRCILGRSLFFSNVTLIPIQNFLGNTQCHGDRDISWWRGCMVWNFWTLSWQGGLCGGKKGPWPQPSHLGHGVKPTPCRVVSGDPCSWVCHPPAESLGHRKRLAPVSFLTPPPPRCCWWGDI